MLRSRVGALEVEVKVLNLGTKDTWGQKVLDSSIVVGLLSRDILGFYPLDANSTRITTPMPAWQSPHLQITPGHPDNPPRGKRPLLLGGNPDRIIGI